MHINKYFLFMIFIIINCESVESSGFKINLSKINYPIDNNTNNSVTDAPNFFTTVSTETSLVPADTKITLSIVEVTTEKIIITTTDVPLANNTNTTDLKKATLMPKPKLIDYYCNCNLKMDICDVNCCCDKDWTKSMLNMFTCSSESFEISDDRKYYGLTPCRLDQNIFCILKDNLDDIDKDTYDTNLKFSVKYKWAEVFPIQEIKKKPQETYFVGDSILMFNELTETINTLDLPYNLYGDYCHIEEPIKYLTHIDRLCLQNSETLLEFHSNFIDKISNVKFLKSPKYAKNNMMMEYCTDENNECFNANTFQCENFDILDNCNKLNLNESQLFETNNYWTHLLLNFQHNLTHLLNLNIFILNENINNDTITKKRQQQIKVNFLYKNETDINNNELSGNIGYLYSKPVLVTQILPINDTDLNEGVYIDYFNRNMQYLNNINYTLKLPTSKYYNCIIEKNNYKMINFGENSFTKCNVHLDIDNLSNNQNYTEICNRFQQKIFFYMINNMKNITNNPDSNIFISEYGNPKNETLKWIKLVNTKAYSNLINGFINTDNDDSFICQNMIINIKYYFYYGNFVVDTASNQFLIKEANFELGARVDLSFSLFEEKKVPIYINVMFINLSKPQ